MRRRRVRILPYKAGSASARGLSRASGIPRLRLVRTRFVPRATDVIVNWGNGSWDAMPSPLGYTILNDPDKVNKAANKLSAFRAFEEGGVSIPHFTQSPEVARGWLWNDKRVVTRDVLRGHSGEGTTVWCKDEYDSFIHRRPSPLYTMYVPKFDEYRVHVWKGQVIDVQQKRRRQDDGLTIDSEIRTHGGGWVYCRGGVECPRSVIQQGILSVEALGLDFGAADIGYTRRSSTATVYEVNTAPGLTGTTLDKYVQCIADL